ncbi:MAG: transglycosylase SLT domain-containing protein [Vicinamibacterales bacterium]
MLALAGSARLVAGPQEGPDPLVPTKHDPVPAQPAAFFLTPSPTTALTQPLRDFARAALVVDAGADAASVAPLLAAPALAASPLADHAKYYRGLIALKQSKLDDAVTLFTAVAASSTRSWVQEQALWRLAETQEQRGQYALAREAWARLLASGPADPDKVAHRLGVAAERAGDLAASIAAHRLVYYDYPLAADADESGRVLARLDTGSVPFPEQIDKLRARAAALYAARRWAAARAAYLDVSTVTTGDVRDGALVRVAGCDVQAKQYRAAVDRLRPLVASGAHQAEAQWQYGLAIRGQGDENGYVQSVRALVAAQPQSPYTEEALNALAVWYVLEDDDAQAAGVFGELVQRFPQGRYAERAAWKAGWWAYRQKQDASAIGYFEIGAKNFPRSDYRPAWLYWSGRAKQRAGDAAGARARFQLVAADYKNSYYGRLALGQLGGPDTPVPPTIAEAAGARSAPPATERQIGLLMGLGLNDLALNELQFARRVYGETPALMATTALAQYRAGRLRPGINAMKRAYPQWMAAGGESLPPDVLRLIFPVDYFQQLEGSAKRRGLDPYVIVALAAQESTFDAGISSSAGAIGLMQIMPATGRALARKVGVKPFTTRRLTDPEVNMTLGTQYFADLMEQFGHAAYALAGYNAGGHRVVRWKSERGELPIDEWIDDIPFPETQNYVKRILGTAEDYRRLYGGGILTPVSSGLASQASPLPAGAPAKVSPAKPPVKKRPAGPTRRPTTSRPRRPGA